MVGGRRVEGEGFTPLGATATPPWGVGGSVLCGGATPEDKCGVG